MRNAIPASISRFQVVGLLGRGGMGAVYRGRDVKIDRPVAIKVLGVNADDDSLRARFLQEARSAGNLHHPNIVTIYEYGEHEGEPFIAMELVDGKTLAELIKTRGRVDLSTAMDYLRQIASALDYAHDKGVIHRDIKPANLMIAGNTLKILDFGIARMGDSSLTFSGATVGTPNYMSPEQVRGQPVDRRSDVFAVGLVFYELLAGVRAFPGNTAHPVMHAVVYESPASLNDLVPHLDPAVVAIVDRAIEKDAGLRFSTLADMVGQLDEIGRNRPVHAVAVALAGVTEISAPPELLDARRTAVAADEVPESTIDVPRPFGASGLADMGWAVFDVQAKLLAGAQAFLDEGDTEHAIELVKRVLELNPDSTEALRIQETVHDLRRRRDTAEVELGPGTANTDRINPPSGGTAAQDAVAAGATPAASALPAPLTTTTDVVPAATLGSAERAGPPTIRSGATWLIVPPDVVPERMWVFAPSTRRASRSPAVIREVTVRGGREWFEEQSINTVGKAVGGVGAALSIAFHVATGGAIAAILATATVPVRKADPPLVMAFAPLEVPPAAPPVAQPPVRIRPTPVNPPVSPIPPPIAEPTPDPPPPTPPRAFIPTNTKPVDLGPNVALQAPPPPPSPPKTIAVALRSGWDVPARKIRDGKAKNLPVGAKGLVDVMVWITEEGTVERVQLMTPTPYGEAAREVALGTVFTAARLNGRPARVQIMIQVDLATR